VREGSEGVHVAIADQTHQIVRAQLRRRLLDAPRPHQGLCPHDANRERAELAAREERRDAGHRREHLVVPAERAGERMPLQSDGRRHRRVASGVAQALGSSDVLFGLADPAGEDRQEAAKRSALTAEPRAPRPCHPLIQLASDCAAHLVVIFLRSVQKSTAAGPVMSP